MTAETPLTVAAFAKALAAAESAKDGTVRKMMDALLAPLYADFKVLELSLAAKTAECERLSVQLADALMDVAGGIESAELARLREDAERYRWLLNNATRMSEPLYDRRPHSHAVTGHRVSVIVSFVGDYQSTPWATQDTFNAAIDAARREGSDVPTARESAAG